MAPPKKSKLNRSAQNRLQPERCKKRRIERGKRLDVVLEKGLFVANPNKLRCV